MHALAELVHDAAPMRRLDRRGGSAVRQDLDVALRLADEQQDRVALRAVVETMIQEHGARRAPRILDQQPRRQAAQPEIEAVAQPERQDGRHDRERGQDQRIEPPPQDRHAALDRREDDDSGDRRHPAIIARRGQDADRDLGAGGGLRLLDRLLDPLRVFVVQHHHLPDEPRPLNPRELRPLLKLLDLLRELDQLEFDEKKLERLEPLPSSWSALSLELRDAKNSLGFL